MIQIANEIIKPEVLFAGSPANAVEAEIIQTLHESTKVYEYRTMRYFKFELTLRNSIVKAAQDLAKSEFSFKNFREATCNRRYWKRTNAGGFLLREDVKSSDAIRDIYANSSKYGTECATAIIIVYYKALVDILPEPLFISLFPNIYLISWHHLDADLGLYESPNPTVYLPGDCRYFNNPDFDPETPECRGENAIDLGGGKYYGHGMGIKTGEEILEELNKCRRHHSQIPATLLRSAKRLNSTELADKAFRALTRR